MRRRPTLWVSTCSRAYPVPLGPHASRRTSARGAQLFQQNCASCHGAKGDAQDRDGAQLDPPPIAFVDRARAGQRSPFALYQVINQGLEGTAMASFAQLPDAGQWALAYLCQPLRLSRSA